MHTIEIPEIDIRMEIPAHWDEMDPHQRHYCLKQAILASLGVITAEEAKVRTLYRLLDLERDWKDVRRDALRSKETRDDKYSRIYLLAEQLVTFLFADREGSLEVNYDTVMNHFPVHRVAKQEFYGPAHLLADLSFGEFRAAIEYMNEYFREKDDIHLCRMIACLYRPQRLDHSRAIRRDDWDGQVRQPWNRAKVEENAQAIHQGLAMVDKVAVLLWFSYVIRYIQTEDLILGGMTVNFSPLFPKGNAPQEGIRQDGYGWTSVLNGLAKEGPFGDIDKTDRAGLFDVLLYLLEMHEQNQKIKLKSRLK